MNQRQLARTAHQHAAATLRIAIDTGELADLIETDTGYTGSTDELIAAINTLAHRHAIAGNPLAR